MSDHIDTYLQTLVNQDVPYSQEAEEAVIGAVLINPSAFIQVAVFLKSTDFYFLKNAYIWRSFENLAKRGDPIDYLTVVDEIKNMGWLNEMGGAPFITHLVNNTPTSIHAAVYGHLVERAAVRREILTASDAIRGLALNTNETLDTIINQAQRQLLQAIGRVVESRGEFADEGVKSLLDDIEAQSNDPAHVVGIPSGYTDLDIMIGGFEKQDFVILAGRPGMGKSALVGCLALNMAKAGYHVGVFPNEMSTNELKRRLLSVETGINSQRIKHARSLSNAEWERIYQASDRIRGLPIYFDDARVTPSQLHAKCLWLKKTWKLDCVLVDGLYRMPANSGETDRYKRFSEIAEDMKNMTRDLDMPVIVTHQISRACEQRQDKRPVLSDLSDSGRIEQEMDLGLFLYRDVVYNEATEMPNLAEIIVSKNRDGSTGTVTAYFEKSLTRFVNAKVTQVSLREQIQQKRQDTK